MTATARDFLRASDNADAYAERLIEELDQDAHEEIDSLMNDPEGRDAALWEDLGVDSELTVKQYEETDPKKRGIDWFEGLAGLSAVAGIQYFLAQRDATIIKPVAYREQVVGSLVITRAELLKAAKRGVDAIEPLTTFEALQAKYVRDLSFLSEMTDLELYGTLRDYNAIRPFEQMVAQQAGYVSRMTGYRPGSTQWTEQVNNLIDLEARGNLKYQNRRAVERVYSYREADGDLNALMMWVGEGGSGTCQYCAELFGETKTYGEWEDFGMPGADICAGGDRCKCHLAAVGRLAA